MRAASPYDRDRRSNGVAFEELDVNSLKICEAAMNAYPNDPQVKFQTALLHHKAQNWRAAVDLYLELAEQNYALALRALASFRANDPSDSFGIGGTSEAWMERSAEAGDGWALVWRARDLALEGDLETNAAEAIRRTRAAGIENFSEAAMLVAEYIAAKEGSEGASPTGHQHTRALFYALIGRHLYENMVHNSRFSNGNRPNMNTDRIREISRILPIDEVGATYRAAISWAEGHLVSGKTLTSE